MKKNIYNFIFGVVFLIASINQANSQNYLNVNNKKDIPFGPAPCGSVVLFPIYFGFQEVSTTFLDIVTVTNAQEPVMRHGNGAWTPNNNGIGSFGNFMSFFEESQHLPNNILVYGNVLVNLRTGVSKKDYVIARNNGLQVHWNTNDSITVVKQLITGSSPTRIETGIFNWEDNSEDVAILDGSNIKIFRNQSDGYLNTSPSSFSVQAKKFKLRQLNEKTEGYVPSNSNDRDDLAVLDIIFGSGTISIFLNDNNNGFNFASPFAEIHPNKAIYDFEIADMDNDGFNDIIIAGVDDPANPTSFYVSVYKNYQGVLIGSTPIWSIESTEFIRSFPHIAVADLSKDGLNDLIIVSDGGYTNVFINKITTPIFGTGPDQVFSIVQNPTSNIWHIQTADIYNTGGIALIASFQSVGFVQNPPPSELYGIFAINATDYNPPPPPPILTGQVHFDGSFYRPKIVLNNRNERDFLQYDIYKYSPGTGGQIVLIGSTSNEEFIDFSEYILVTENGDTPAWNCYYYAKEVDQSSKVSINSAYAYYTVGVPCMNCAGPVEDNPISQNQMSYNVSKEFTLTNFPNPFNPITKIYFNIPIEGNVRITFYNSVGQTIKTIIDENKPIGTHVTEFNAGNLPSGVYFYKFESSGYTRINKMLFIK